MENIGKDGLTDQEAGKLVELLGKLRRPYREDIFQAVCATFVMCPIELVALTHDGKALMTRRPPNDRHFAGLWHTPGTLLLKGDTVKIALERIAQKDELRGLPHTTPEFVFMQEVEMGKGDDQCPRQQEYSRVYITWVYEEHYVGEGRFFPLNDLPPDSLRYHKHHHMKRLAEMFQAGTLPGQRSWQGL